MGKGNKYSDSKEVVAWKMVLAAAFWQGRIVFVRVREKGFIDS